MGAWKNNKSMRIQQRVPVKPEITLKACKSSRFTQRCLLSRSPFCNGTFGGKWREKFHFRAYQSQLGEGGAGGGGAGGGDASGNKLTKMRLFRARNVSFPHSLFVCLSYSLPKKETGKQSQLWGKNWRKAAEKLCDKFI